ncbi:MAG: ribose 5-phosphate isomerase A [Methanopyri archaeon]|nr:ribose 5-phosphate isomerase A [Methanopyri archaeon]
MSGKREAAESAADMLEDLGVDLVAVGAGTTVEEFLRVLAERGYEGTVLAPVPGTLAFARELGLEVTPVPPEDIPVAVDGADAVDDEGNVVKGGGACHAIEKAVDYAADELWIIVDESKLVEDIFSVPVPVEVLASTFEFTIRELEAFGEVEVRRGNGKYGPIVSDNGNPIVDLRVEGDPSPSRLEMELNAVPGVVENGVFPADSVDRVIVGGAGRG